MTNISVEQLAQNFLDATVNKWGTDEDVVDSTLQEVHDRGIETEFNKSVYLKTEGQFVSTILKDELSGSALARAEDLLQVGYETYRADASSYFVEGLTSAFDFSSTSSKILGGAALLSLAILYVACPPVGALVAGGLAVGFAGVGASEIIYHGAKIAMADTNAQKKESLRGMGNGVGLFATAAPFVPKGLRAIRGFKPAFGKFCSVKGLTGSFFIFADQKGVLPAFQEILPFFEREDLIGEVKQLVGAAATAIFRSDRYMSSTGQMMENMKVKALYAAFLERNGLLTEAAQAYSENISLMLQLDLDVSKSQLMSSHLQIANLFTQAGVWLKAGGNFSKAGEMAMKLNQWDEAIINLAKAAKCFSNSLVNPSESYEAQANMRNALQLLRRLPSMFRGVVSRTREIELRENVEEALDSFPRPLQDR